MIKVSQSHGRQRRNVGRPIVGRGAAECVLTRLKGGALRYSGYGFMVGGLLYFDGVKINKFNNFGRLITQCR